MEGFKHKGVTYKVGDKVLLVNKRTDKWNEDGLMDKYLGKVVTISDIGFRYPGGITFGIVENNPKKDGWGCKWEFFTKDIVKKVSGTFFKKLPNDFTGTINVVNGYIHKPQILDEEEKKYLVGIIRPFRDIIISISKATYFENEEYIHFETKNQINNFSLPNFKKDTMYKGMELSKEYTLEELGLFEEE